MPTLADAIRLLQSGDTSQPAITCYDRSGGPTDGERIELSGRVLLTWAAKAAGALQDELLVEPGATVGLALPPHWRLGYWALATWWVGATLVTGPQAADADVLVTDDVALAADHPGDRVLVTLAGLARSHPGPVPAGVMDEARELASYPDRFVPSLRPAGSDLAWRATDRVMSYAEELWGRTGRALVVAGGTGAETCLRSMVEHWVGGGSVVLVRSAGAGLPDADVATIRVAERITD
ncbi:TIGR03089 family protein [Arsenicicoccus dermatophilus]|uniref:TIGR03089 family protein n=1 Tax=Arsenicicoccus dermatophilus TaxID=1076331 RepID=UPI003916E31B